MSHIFVYRNCFTGDVSGGDMHTGGVCDWINTKHPEHPLYLVHAVADGQEEAYRETNDLHEITYQDTGFRSPALMFPARAAKGNRVPLPLHESSNIFIAGSHFMPDVWPVVGQARQAPGAVRLVYIHHVIQDMPRTPGVNTMLANMQEQFCFSLIKHHFDAIVTTSDQVTGSLRRRGFTQPILLSTNFVNAHTARPRGYDRKDITLLFCGRLVPQKGVDDFLAVCEAAQTILPDFNAVMIGAGPEEERLRGIIAKKQLKIELTGFVPEKQKFAMLARAKLFVLPSIEEGWGIVIAESMSVGTPIVAYRLPAYATPFGDHISTVPLKSRKRLIKRVMELLTAYEIDPTAYAAAQKDLAGHAATFDRETVAANEYAFVMEQTND